MERMARRERAPLRPANERRYLQGCGQPLIECPLLAGRCRQKGALAKKKRSTQSDAPLHNGASDEARTRYLHLGKVALYQMSYTRMNEYIINTFFSSVKKNYFLSVFLLKMSGNGENEHCNSEGMCYTFFSGKF